MLRISACVITKNEEKNIVRWLDGVRSLASEIIVVDTGSQDNTVELAKAGGAEVYFFSWCDDFSAAKNFALDQATGDWVVFLDADEMFSRESIPKVRLYIEKFHPDRRIAGIICQLFNIETAEDNRLIDKTYQMRVFRNEKTLRYVGKVHEMICNQFLGVRKLQMTDLIIYHTGYSKALLQEKCKRNLAILQEEVKKAGKEKPEHYPYFTDVYMGLSDYEKTMHYARLSLENKSGLVGMESKAYRRLIDSMTLLKKPMKEREAVIDEAIDAMPAMPEFLWDKGEVLYEQKKYEESKSYLLRSLQQSMDKRKEEPEQCMTDSMDARKPYIYMLLGEIARLQGRPSGALEYFVDGLRLYPYHYGIFAHMYQLLRDEDPVNIIEFLDTLYDKKRDINFLMQALRQNWAGAVYIYYARYWDGADENHEYAKYMAAGRYDAAVVKPEMKMRRLLPLGLWSCLDCQQNYDKAEFPLILPPMYMQVYEKMDNKNKVLDANGNIIYDSLWRMEGRRKSMAVMSDAEAAILIEHAAGEFKTGHRVEAIRQLLQSYKKYPASSLLVYGLASLLQADGAWENARKVLLTAQTVTEEMHTLWAELQEDPQYPLVSIMIPTYNRPVFLELALRSACAQTYTNVEIIVCDNSTDDATEKVMMGYKNNLRVRYVRNQEAQNKKDNFCLFAQLAHGEFLQWCMDDDVLGREKISRMVAAFQAHPGIHLVTSVRGVIDENDILQGQVFFPESIETEYRVFPGRDAGKMMLLSTSNYLGEPSAVLFRRRDLQNHYWNAECRGYKTISDVVMWLELLHSGDCLVFREPLSYYRRHDEQEGQQMDVVLLSRLEWYRLIGEDSAEHYFLTSNQEVRQALHTIYDESAKLLALIRSKDEKQQVDAALVQEYQQCIVAIGKQLE